MGSTLSRLTTSPSSPSTTRTGPFTPSYYDVLAAIDILTTHTPVRLPIELAICIFDLAEYYPVLESSLNRTVLVQAGWQGHKQGQVLVLTDPIPAHEGAPEHAVRRITIQTESKDQGFSSFPQLHNTRQGSSSWFETVLLRPDPLAPPPSASSPPAPPSSSPATPPTANAVPGAFPSPHSLPPPSSSFLDQTIPAAERTYSPVCTVRLHNNLHASREFTTFCSVLSSFSPPPTSPDVDALDEPAAAEPVEGLLDPVEGAKLVRAARAGDRIAVLALAQYPMWVNNVKECRVRIEIAAV